MQFLPLTVAARSSLAGTLGSRNWKSGQGPTKGCRAIIIIIIIITGKKGKVVPVLN
jgi:hypothetical protein